MGRYETVPLVFTLNIVSDNAFINQHQQSVFESLSVKQVHTNCQYGESYKSLHMRNSVSVTELV